jgi:3-methyladenine DNA glycosylase AlkC
MGTLLKDLYSEEFYTNFGKIVCEIDSSFDTRKFITMLFDEHWNQRELKERMKHTSEILHLFFPSKFFESALLIEKIVAKLIENKIKQSSVEFMFFPDYIERYGLHDFDVSVRLMEKITSFTSCEFAVRPFLIKYGDKMYQQMFAWSKNQNHHVRRLSSEGSRPRLPWAMALPELKKDPSYIIPLLENLKTDPSEYVRRSVANSLNDISKDNPEILLKLIRNWDSNSKETAALIKHACRTLLKNGHPEILSYYNLDNTHMELSKFKILDAKVHIGERVTFSFSLKNTSSNQQTVRLEYAIYHIKKNGKHTKKVFKISERIYAPSEIASILRKHDFKIISTRKYYQGLHKIALIINGHEYDAQNFELISA